MARQRSSENALSSKSSNKTEPRQYRPFIEFHILTLFPEVFPLVLTSSLMGKAQQKGLVSFNLVQIRDFAEDRHRTVDDTPYGGGEGMLLKADILYSAWRRAVPRKAQGTLTVLLSPQGAVFDQEMAKELASYRKIVLVCGHYEGVDERFIELCVDREISIGDYVLTGGEIPALVISDAVTRLLPGVIGKSRSVTQDSLEGHLLKYPQYTRPREFRGLQVPEILLSGNHPAIEAWRRSEMWERTRRKRPDLYEKAARAQLGRSGLALKAEK